jgi:lysophospholipase L1-like esterase
MAIAITRRKIQGFCICLLCISALFSAEHFLKKYDRLYYLPQRDFWRLDLFTDLAGQFDGKKEFILRHTGVPYDEKVVVKKPVGVQRFIVLGTSSAEGYGVFRGDNFAGQLQYLLNSHYGNGKFEVINAAVGGRVSYQLLVYFQEVLLKLSPDIVILYLAHNDSYYDGPFTARNYYKKIQKAFLDAGNNHAKKERLLKYGLNGLNPLYPFFVESRLFGYLFVKTSRNFVNGIQLVPPRDQEYVLREFVSLSKRYHFKLIFAPEMVRRGEREVVTFPYYSLMENVAEKEHIPFINVMPSLREYPDDKVFLENDPMHLNPLGHQLVARELFRQINAVIGSDGAPRTPSSNTVK